MPEFTVDTDSIEAVKKAYIDGSLEIRPGYWTYWVGGRQKCGYVNAAESMDLAWNCFQQWVKEENAQRVWMEDPVRSYLSSGLSSQKTK